MSLNYILIWLTGLGSVFGVLRNRGREEAEILFVFRSALLTFATLVTGVFVLPAFAGYIACVPWLIGMVLPQVLLTRLIAAYELGDSVRALRCAQYLKLLPGASRWAVLWERLISTTARLGSPLQESALKEKDLELLSRLTRTASLASLYARAALLYSLSGWRELLLFSEEIALRGQGRRPSFHFTEMHLVALAELGRWKDALGLLNGYLEYFPKGSEARVRLLNRLLQYLPPQELSIVSIELEGSTNITDSRKTPWAINLLSGLCCLGYLAEVVFGVDRVIELLAFDPFQILLLHEWWRIVTCGLVHADLLHLGSNVLGIAILGPFLARHLGSLRFAVFFFVALVGASLIMLGLMWFSIAEPNPMIGASGGVMGLVGGYLSYYMNSYRRTGSLYHKEQLRGILLIVCLQTLFDIMTPRVSFFAHLGGLATGLLLFPLVSSSSVQKS
ncbi:MAG: rhomboid family intramembrane serine protease [Bdellovibrionales bacterium]|nr:rhomboid family intramembrane serine protease [Bdellovibrionales bacterium]